jgi:methyl-accepting chemotaxis protein
MAKWTIGKKIAAGFLVVLMQALSVGVYALWMTSRTSGKLRLISSEYLPETQSAAQVERDLLNARIHFIYFVTIQKEGSLEKGWQRFHAAQQQLPKLRDVVARSEVFAPIRSDVDQLLRDFDSYEPVLERIIAVVQRHQNQGPEFNALIKEWARLGGVLVDSAGRLSRRGMEAADQSAQEASSRQATLTLAGACVAGLIIGVVLTFFVSRGIARALRRVIQMLGDSAHQVTGAASQIASSAQSLSQGASEQAASLEETSASTEEINAMASKNADNAKSAAADMMEASQRIGEANVNLEQMVGSMNEINASSDKISKIIKVIDEIAFQTDILALNAAVEAARAGEAGAGFAVVAEEVRSLAHRSAQAAKETAGMIENSVQKSTHGVQISAKVAARFNEIVTKARQVDELVASIATASKEQSQGIDQISTTVSSMDKVTQSNAATAEQCASAAVQLNAQAESLTSAVQDLQFLIDGQRPVDPAPTRPDLTPPVAAAPAAPRRPKSARTPAAR